MHLHALQVLENLFRFNSFYCYINLIWNVLLYGNNNYVFKFTFKRSKINTFCCFSPNYKNLVIVWTLFWKKTIFFKPVSEIFIEISKQEISSRKTWRMIFINLLFILIHLLSIKTIHQSYIPSINIYDIVLQRNLLWQFHKDSLRYQWINAYFETHFNLTEHSH